MASNDTGRFQKLQGPAAKRQRGFYIDPPRVQRYIEERLTGTSIRQSAEVAKVTQAWANANDKILSASVDEGWRTEDKKGPSPGGRVASSMPMLPIPYEDVKGIAFAALEDFDVFRRRHMGRVPLAWHKDAQEKMVEALASPHREFLVMNVPPGSGKSTLSHDIQAWLIARNRRIRILQGSKSETAATRFVNRLKRTLERRRPVDPSIEDVERNLATPATSTLWADYGPFKPDTAGHDLWTRNSFITQQHDDIPIDEKEPTVTAFGMDSHSLGMRVDLAIWDDLVDKESVRTEHAISAQRDFLDSEAETRIDAGGLFVLIGQRLSPDDLYRYAIDKLAYLDDDLEGDEDVEVIDFDKSPKKYTQIIYPAHYEDLCEGIHKVSRARPWPDGCLLDPQRVAWRELRALKANSPHRYETVYQQQDLSLEDTLIPEAWIKGGDLNGVSYVGCYDDRSMFTLPDRFEPPFSSIITADPSPTKFWAVQWWLVHNETKTAHLIALEKQTMEAPDFLDQLPTGDTVGLLEDWAVVARRLGIPLTHVIFEANVAQRFFLQFTFVKEWMRKWKVLLIPHTTAANKADPDVGIAMIREPFRTGNVRLPMPNNPIDKTRIQTLKLVEELTRYPHQAQDDQVMATWFLFHNLEKIVGRSADSVPKALGGKPPTWAQDADSPLNAGRALIDSSRW